MAVTKILLLCACVALVACNESEGAPLGSGGDEGAGGAGAGHEQQTAAVLQQALAALQALLADGLAAPQQLWASQADDVRARSHAILEQVTQAAGALGMALAAAKQHLGETAEQFRREHPELAAREAALQALLGREEAVAEAEETRAASPTDQGALHELAAVAARAQLALAQLWGPHPQQPAQTNY